MNDIDVPPGHKLCKRCGTVTPVSEWHKDKWQKDGLQTACATCKKAQARDHRVRKPEMKTQNFYDRRTRPGTCSKKGCNAPKPLNANGFYNDRCLRHDILVRSKSDLKKAREARDLAYGRVNACAE